MRLSIIGLGMASEPHARALTELRDKIEVRVAASPSTTRTEAFAARYGFPVTNDVDAVIADPSTDAILLLTPPNTHFDLGSRIIAQGKHLLVEKPLEVSIAKAEALVDAAASANLALGVVFQHRFRPASLRLAEIVASDSLGAIEGASMTVPWWRPQSYYDEPGRGTVARDGGGVLLNQSIHTIDLFRSLVGRIEVIAAHARTTASHQMETEDLAMALLRLSNGAPATLLATTAAYPGRPETIDIIGSLGSASLVGDALTVRWIDGSPEETIAAAPIPAGDGPMNFSHEPHRVLIENFADAVAAGRAPRASGAEALESQKLVERILAKARA